LGQIGGSAAEAALAQALAREEDLEALAEIAEALGQLREGRRPRAAPPP
jgi:hypothetical protein